MNGASSVKISMEIRISKACVQSAISKNTHNDRKKHPDAK